jgi:hypothetical protein
VRTQGWVVLSGRPFPRMCKAPSLLLSTVKKNLVFPSSLRERDLLALGLWDVRALGRRS